MKFDRICRGGVQKLLPSDRRRRRRRRSDRLKILHGEAEWARSEIFDCNNRTRTGESSVHLIIIVAVVAGNIITAGVIINTRGGQRFAS